MKKRLIIPIAISMFAISACEDFFSPNADNVLLEKDYIGSSSELYSGYMGLAACVQDVVDKGWFLEGLRGDWLEPTPNAPQYMWDIYQYKDQTEAPFSGNPLADPKEFYRLIINCNDYLAHVFDYRESNPNVLSKSDYNGIIGGALRYKAWAYLQLAKFYGEAVYFDEPLTEYGAINKYPVLKFEQLIDQCISLIEIGQNGVNGKGDISWSANLYPGQVSATTEEWKTICPLPECLLAELYLFKATYSDPSMNQTYYQLVWDNCVKIIRDGGVNKTYQLNLSDYNGSWKQLFSRTSYSRMDHIAVAFYDYTVNQTNHVIDYYSDVYPNKYYLRPAATAINRWKESDGNSGTNNDQNYRGLNKSYREATNGSLVFCKFIDAHTSSDLIYRNDVFLCYYKAADIHLFLVEALAGMGRFREALIFLNGKSFPYDGFSTLFNREKLAFEKPLDKYPSTLYNVSINPSSSDFLNQSDRMCQGIRGRVSAPSVGDYLIDGYFRVRHQNPDWLARLDEGKPTSDPNHPSFIPDNVAPRITSTRAHWVLDSLCVNEARLESAGEARSYFAMYRANKRWGAESRRIWAKKIADKYSNSSIGSMVGSRLELSDENWFIKYNLNK